MVLFVYIRKFIQLRQICKISKKFEFNLAFPKKKTIIAV